MTKIFSDSRIYKEKVFMEYSTGILQNICQKENREAKAKQKGRGPRKALLPCFEESKQHNKSGKHPAYKILRSRTKGSFTFVP